MKEMDIILSGLGGQGILFITKIISLTAINKGYNVLASETHGMAQRGGSVISHLRIGNKHSSQINTGAADCIISLDGNETIRNLHFLKHRGKIFTNVLDKNIINSKITSLIFKKNIELNIINGSKIVKKLSAPLSLNLAILGFFCSFKNEILDIKNTIKTIKKVSPPKFIETNLRIFKICGEKSDENLQN